MDNNEKEAILRNYLSTMSKAIHNKYEGLKFNGSPYDYHCQRRCLSRCFSKLIPKYHNIIKLKLKYYLGGPSFLHAGWTVYDISNMTTFQDFTNSDVDFITREFTKKVLKLPIPNRTYQKMSDIAKSPATRSDYFDSLKKSSKKHHLIGIMALTFIISIIIPNMPIDAFGDFLGSIGLYTVKSISNFCVNKIETLIDPALIGRLFINLVIDIPVLLHYNGRLNK